MGDMKDQASDGPVPQIRVTVEDLLTGDSEACEIGDDYILITAGRVEMTGVQAYPTKGTHVLTIKNVGRGVKRPATTTALQERLAATERLNDDLAAAFWAAWKDTHVLDVGDDGWALRHPIQCRQRPGLLACAFHRAALAMTAPIAEPGAYNVGLTWSNGEPVLGVVDPFDGIDRIDVLRDLFARLESAGAPDVSLEPIPGGEA